MQLKFSKKEAVILAKKMYYQDTLPCLQRKKEKVFCSLEKIKDMSEW